MEPLLRGGVREEGRGAAWRLFAHDRLDALPPRLSDRPPDRLPDRAADEKGGSYRAGIRAHGHGGQHRSGSMDEESHGRSRRCGGASRRDAEGARRPAAIARRSTPRVMEDTTSRVNTLELDALPGSR